MCGINAIFSKTDKISKEDLDRFEALFVLTEERGLDASGLCWDTDAEIKYYKGNLTATDLLKKAKEENHFTKDDIGRWVFGHARWATDGTPDDNKNNHPVISRDKRVALVHNGILSMQKLEDYKYKGEVDTEVLVSYIATNGVSAALKEVRGSAAIICFYDDIYNREQSEDRLFVWRHSSPAILGETETAYFIASTISLLSNTLGVGAIQNYTVLNEHMLYELTSDGLVPLEHIEPERDYAYRGSIYEGSYWDSILEKDKDDTTKEPAIIEGGIPFRWFQKEDGKWDVIPYDVIPSRSVIALPRSTIATHNIIVPLPPDELDNPEYNSIENANEDVVERLDKLKKYMNSLEGKNKHIKFCVNCAHCPCMTCTNTGCDGPSHPLYVYCLATKCGGYLKPTCIAPINSFPTQIKVDIARIQAGF